MAILYKSYEKAEKQFTFDDVLLVPQYSKVKSRSNCVIDSCIGGVTVSPFCIANMDTVVGDELIDKACKHNVITFTPRNYRGRCVGNVIPTIGISDKDFETALEYKKEGFRSICIDIAHGHSEHMIDQIQRIKEHFEIIVAGNVCTFEGFRDLANVGATVIKVGVGPGCFTPNMTVHTNISPKAIKDVNIGDYVLTHTGEYKEVLATLSYHTNEEIIVINGIECTKNHEFYVVKNEDLSKITDENIHQYAHWVKSKDLTNDYSLIESLE